MFDCRTRDVSDHIEYCDTHLQDASLCHINIKILPVINKSRRTKKVRLKILIDRDLDKRTIEQRLEDLTDYGFMDRIELNYDRPLE